MLSVGITVKETAKIGPRPEKPIEIYEFEGYVYALLILCLIVHWDTFGFYFSLDIE